MTITKDELASYYTAVVLGLVSQVALVGYVTVNTRRQSVWCEKARKAFVVWK